MQIIGSAIRKKSSVLITNEFKRFCERVHKIFLQCLACEKKTKKFIYKYGTENAVIKGKIFHFDSCCHFFHIYLV